MSAYLEFFQLEGARMVEVDSEFFTGALVDGTEQTTRKKLDMVIR